MDPYDRYYLILKCLSKGYDMEEGGEVDLIV